MSASRDDTLATLRADVAVAAIEAPALASLAPALAWTRALWSLGADRAPLYLVHDLGWILLRGNHFRAPLSPARPGDPRRARDLAWRDDALWRWCADESARDVHVVLAATPVAERDDAVAHALSRCVPRLLARAPSLPHGNPAHLRDALEALAGDLGADPLRVARALESRDALRRALPSTPLFSPEDRWEISHRRVLPDESARMSLRALHHLVAQTPPCPGALMRELRRGPAANVVDEAASGAYPAGGFDGLSTRGAMENLVRTEAAFHGERVPGLGEMDLLTLRLALDEALFYTRDESPLPSARRDLCLVFDRPAALRVKRPSHPAQALLLLDALALCAHRDLSLALGGQGLRTTLCWRAESPEDREVANDEQALLRIALTDELAHRRVRFADAPSANDVTVVLSASPRPEHHRRDAWLCAQGDTWDFDGAVLDPRDLRAPLDAVLRSLVTR